MGWVGGRRRAGRGRGRGGCIHIAFLGLVLEEGGL